MSVGSPEPGSSSNSQMGLDSVNLNKNAPMPEQWTLPHEWNIEKRELYDTWKLDVQYQISTIDRQLKTSLNQYPVNGYGRSAPNGEWERSQMKRSAQDLRGKMQIGLRRE